MARDTELGGGGWELGLLDLGAERLEKSLIKKSMDILGAAIGIFFLLPLLLLVALAIVIESPGSPLFEQRRSGRRGVPFVIYKFRTMRVREDGPNVVQAKRGDQRVTRVGQILRRTSVDELPQLINVLRGEMSLIGPRPHALAHDHYYSQNIDKYSCRYLTKPGLTGLAQVCGLRGATPDNEVMAARVQKDLEYIRDWSLLMDLRILLRTALIVTFHASAY